MVNQVELKRVVAFLEANGWKFDGNDDGEYSHFVKGGSFGVDISHSRIVFIGDVGDFADIPLNYYYLLGYMYHHRMLQPVIPDFMAVAPGLKEVKP